MINPYLQRGAHGGGGIAAVPHEAVSSVSAAAEEAGVAATDPVECAACKSGERIPGLVCAKPQSTVRKCLPNTMG